MLQNLHFSNNEISNIPDGTFMNSPNLRALLLNSNRIVRLASNSLAGTAIEFLDLSNNLFMELETITNQPINSTLVTLDLLNNLIATSSENAFENVRGLRQLVLSGNAFINLPPNVFLPLTNLEFLGLSNCGLADLEKTEWFTNLQNLRTLYIASNQIREIPTNAFNPLTNLEELYIYSNQLVELRRDSFGASLESLRLIYGVGNSLNLVDPQIITGATSLNYLFLLGNLCTDLNFYDVSEDPNFAIERLERCITNFATEPAIDCNYMRSDEDVYWCEMTLQNPAGREFDRVSGGHVGGAQDGDVEFVSVDGQNTRIIPNVICQQFTGLNR